MKLILLATPLLIGLNAPAISAEKNLNFKLVAIYMGEKDGETHMMGVTVTPDGSIGTKDFYDKTENGKGTGHSTYYFPDGSVVANYSTVVTGTNTGGHVLGKYQIISGTGSYQGVTGTGSFEGDWGDKSPLKNAELYNVKLDLMTPGT